MAAHLRLRACVWALGIVAILAAAGCDSTNRDEQISTAESLAEEGAPSPPGTAASAVDAFAACDDIPDVVSVFDSGPAYDSLPSSIFRIVGEYGAAHSDEFGFMWNGGVRDGAIVAAFTADIEAHRRALEALLPEGTPFDVVKVDHSHAALQAVQASIGRLEGMQGIGIWTVRNRVSLDFVDPTDATLERLADTVPIDMICLQVVYSVKPPSGLLDIIPLDGADDPPTDCWWGGYDLSTTRCENRVVLPPGLAHVAVHLNPAAMPAPADTSIWLLVTEAGCTSGRKMGDALRGPQVVETDDAVVVAFAVVPYVGMANCPDNPDAHVTVELSRPLGARDLLHGVLVPPEPIQLRPGASTSAESSSEQLTGGAPAQFEAMWDFEPNQEPMVDNALLGGVLVIEGLCAYLDVEWPDEADGETDAEPVRQRWLLRLLDSATRYDPATGALWMRDRGPFFSGDDVEVDGGEGAEALDSTPCSFDNAWWTHAMSPADR